MKKILSCAVIALVVGLALPALAADVQYKTHEVSVQFVSFNQEAKTVTFKDMKGVEQTVPVLEPALASFNGMKAGDKVTLTCADNDKGEHVGVSAAKLVSGKSK